MTTKMAAKINFILKMTYMYKVMYCMYFMTLNGIVLASLKILRNLKLWPPK